MKDNNRERTFSKTMVTLILTVAVIDAQLPFILSAFGKEPVESLGGLFVTEIIAVCLGYFIKSYLGKRNEENIKLAREQMTADAQDNNGDAEG